MDGELLPQPPEMSFALSDLASTSAILGSDSQIVNSSFFGLNHGLWNQIIIHPNHCTLVVRTLSKFKGIVDNEMNREFEILNDLQLFTSDERNGRKTN
jgi:hypothetical protein